MKKVEIKRTSALGGYKGMIGSMESKKKQQQSARRKQEEMALNRLLMWFAIAIGYEALVLLIKRFYVNFRATEFESNLVIGLIGVFSVFQWVGLVLTAAAAVWTVLWKKQGRPAAKPAIVTAVLFALWCTVFVTYRFSSSGGVDLLSAVAPAGAVLAMVYYLYQREFFCNTVISGCGILSLWLYRRLFQYHPTAIYAGYVLAWVLLAAAAVVFWKLSQSGGKWKKYRIFPDNISYAPAYATCAITALVLAAALIGGAAAAFYSIFVLVIWLFCMAVYYTVRLM